MKDKSNYLTNYTLQFKKLVLSSFNSLFSFSISNYSQTKTGSLIIVWFKFKDC